MPDLYFFCCRNADVAVFDAGDVYTAGVVYELVPFIAEVYNLGKPEYYVVAVAKEEDQDTELTYLRGKLTEEVFLSSEIDKLSYIDISMK